MRCYAPWVLGNKKKCTAINISQADTLKELDIVRKEFGAISRTTTLFQRLLLNKSFLCGTEYCISTLIFFGNKSFWKLSTCQALYLAFIIPGICAVKRVLTSHFDKSAHGCIIQFFLVYTHLHFILLLNNHLFGYIYTYSCTLSIFYIYHPSITFGLNNIFPNEPTNPQRVGVAEVEELKPEKQRRLRQQSHRIQVSNGKKRAPGCLGCI